MAFDSYMDIPGKSRNEHLLAGSMSLQQLFPNSHQVWGLLLTRFTLRSVGQSTFFLVRRLSGGLGRSGGAVEWWSGGAVIQSVIPLLSWAVYSSVLCRESRVLQISVLRLLLRSGDTAGALAFVNVSPSKARRARAQPPSCNNSYASRPVATYKLKGSSTIEWGQGYCSGCHASVARALPWVLSACKRNTS